MSGWRAPAFWDDAAAPAGRLLAPAGRLYGALAPLARKRARPAPLPVLCVGNAVLGGAGKTPVALALGARLAAAGKRPHFLTRGYGGRLRGPLRVDPARHDAGAVGDEPLLLARAAPTWVARDRHAGALAAAEAGADALVLDDGFQSGGLMLDLALLVADGAVGYGNGRVFPAGPLREPAAAAHARADALVVIGREARPLPNGLPRLHARLAPEPGAERLAGEAVFGFAGIGRPGKFAETLRELGAELAGFRAFPDHHRYRPEEAMALLEEARALDARCVTTEKDALRLPPDIRPAVETVGVALEWRDPDALDRLLQAKGPIA